MPQRRYETAADRARAYVAEQVMKPITLQDLNAAITDAQCRVCIQHLREMRCPICQEPKGYYDCFCKACYFCLPQEMRPPLYIARDTVDNLTRFVNAYLAAKNFLRELGRAA